MLGVEYLLIAPILKVLVPLKDFDQRSPADAKDDSRSGHPQRLDASGPIGEIRYPALHQLSFPLSSEGF